MPGFDVKKVLQWGIRYELWTFMLYPTVWGNGGAFFSKDGKQVLLDKPETIEAIQRLADLMNKDQVMPPTSSTTSMAAAQTQLQTGQIGFYVSGQWELLDFGKKGFPYGVGRPAHPQDARPDLPQRSERHFHFDQASRGSVGASEVDDDS